MQEMLTNLQLQIDSLATQRLSPTSTNAYNTMETPIQQTHQCMPTSTVHSRTRWAWSFLVKMITELQRQLLNFRMIIETADLGDCVGK